MNMKKIICIAIAVVFTLSFSGCEDFLDTENYTKQNTSNFGSPVKPCVF